MTRNELEHTRTTLLRVKDKDGKTPPEIALAVAYCDKDLALREIQRERQRDNMRQPSDWPW